MAEVWLIRQSYNRMKEFYRGKTYIVQGVRYGVFTSHPESAKHYTSEARARTAQETLKKSVDGLSDGSVVVPLSDCYRS